MILASAAEAGWVSGLSVWGLLGVLVVSLLLLAKGADLVVEQAVLLSASLRVPPVLIGATVVSLGTTLPEMMVSVVAAIQGQPEIALGNAVGSIICDTGLILGVGALIRPLPIDYRIVNKQGWIQFGAAVLLVVLCLPLGNLSAIWTEGGNLAQGSGFLLVALLVAYLAWSVRFSRTLGATGEEEGIPAKIPGLWMIFGKLILGLLLVIFASKATIPTAGALALKVGIPPEVIAVSLVALGTSLPELVTVITSVLKGRGDLAIGNIIGADILNVFFVAGISASVTPGGLDAAPGFFLVIFPFMLGILVAFRVGILAGRTHFTRPFGILMLLIYGAFLWVSYA